MFRLRYFCVKVVVKTNKAEPRTTQQTIETFDCSREEELEKERKKERVRTEQIN